MSDVLLASSEGDARAVEAIAEHHGVLAGSLTTRVERLLAVGDGWEPVRDELVAWCAAELVPHAQAEEGTLYPAAALLDRGRLLVDAMVAEHGVIRRLVEDLAAAADGRAAGATGKALQVLFEVHLSKENEQLLPLLAEDSGVDLAGLLEGVHDRLGAQEHHGDAAQAGCGGHQCSCGEVDGPGYPELDARSVPHAIRHATIFGALDAVAPGGGLVLVAPHDPLPLLSQVEQRTPGRFDVSYVERGPDAWRLRFSRARGRSQE